MMDNWEKTLAEIGVSGPEEKNEFGNPDEGMEEAGMVLSSGFGNLYKYELSDWREKTKTWIPKATKYAIPVVGKKGDFKVFKGDTPEAALKNYQNGVAKGGDTETTFTDISQADKYLKESHGTLGTEIWHVTKLIDLGPVNPSAPPAQVSTPTIEKAPQTDIIQSAQQATEQGKTQQQVMALEKEFSFTEWAKTGKNAIYIIAGVGVVVVIAGVAIVLARSSPAGRVGEAAGGLLRGLRRRD
jgi:hypothetical protein